MIAESYLKGLLNVDLRFPTVIVELAGLFFLACSSKLINRKYSLPYGVTVNEPFGSFSGENSTV